MTEPISDSNSFPCLDDWVPDDRIDSRSGYFDFLSRFQRSCMLRTSYALDRVQCKLSNAPSSTFHENKIRISMISSTILGPRLPSTEKNEYNEKKYKHEEQLLFPRSTDFDRKIFLPASEKKLKKGKRRKYDAEAWASARSTEFRAALQHLPDIICSPEFSVPQPPIEGDALGYPLVPHSGSRFLEYAKRICEEVKQANKKSEKNYAPFICCGSYHSSQEHYNKAVILPLGQNLDEVPADLIYQKIGGQKIIKKHKLQIPSFHRKMFPARRMGENVRVPGGNQFLTYRTMGLTIAVMICSDIVDLNQTLNLGRLGSLRKERSGIDIIVLPSYNAGKPFLTFCQELSFIASTTVVYVNANPEFNEFPKSDIFICGYPSRHISTLSEEYSSLLKLHKKEVVTHHDKLDGKATITTFDIDKKLLEDIYLRMRHIAKSHFDMAGYPKAILEA